MYIVCEPEATKLNPLIEYPLGYVPPQGASDVEEGGIEGDK